MATRIWNMVFQFLQRRASTQHHTDGLKDYFTLLYFRDGRDYDNQLPAAEVLDLISRQQATNFEPGTEYLYANSGYLLLAKIVEAVANKSLDAFTQERIFSPLGMNDTQYVHDFRALIRHRAEGYTQEGGRWLSPRSRFAEIGPSGLVTTVLDLAKWMNAIRNQAFGKELALLQVAKGRLSNGDPADYGYGLFIQRYHGLNLYQHGGGRPGYYSNLVMIPDLDLGIALLCNHSSIDAVATTNSIIEIMAGPDLIQPPKEINVGSRMLHSLVGIYQFESNAQLEITSDGKRLFAQAPEQGKYEIFPTSNLDYFWKVADIQASFQKDAEGKIGSLVVTQGGEDKLAVRIARVKKTPKYSNLEDYVGRYWSDELAVTYEFLVLDGSMMMKVGAAESLVLARESDDLFRFMGSSIHFSRNVEGRIDALLLSAARARNIKFRRL